MENELVEIVRFKRYIELSPREKDDLKEWCNSEEEFDQLKDVMQATAALSMSEKVFPKKETKASLDQLFSQKQGEKKPVFWYNSILTVIFPTEKKWIYRPVFQFAAVCLLVVLLYPFFASKEIVEETSQVATTDNGTSIKQTETPKSTNEKEKALNVSTSTENQQTANSENPGVVAQQRLVATNYADQTGSAQIQEEIAFSDGAQSGIERAVSTMEFSPFSGGSGVSRDTYQDEKFDENRVHTNRSQSAAKQPGLFDLLTATF
jgi:hypothetical protein